MFFNHISQLFEPLYIMFLTASFQRTSPLTNLRLEHLNVAPNHSLRQAIVSYMAVCPVSFLFEL